MRYLAKTFFGLEGVLAQELKEAGASDIEPLNRAVGFSGDRRLLYKANYCLRTAVSILMPIADFRINSPDDLMKNSLKIEWAKYLDSNQTFLVVPVVNSPLFRHTGYPGLVLKDAIADWFRKRKGSRPSVDTRNPGIVFNLHISGNKVTISVDSSVIPLFKRGYRKEQGTAPMNEVLAAGIILLSGWDGKSPLIDPMCGSGTIPIEASLIALGIPPGKFRTYYGFQRWKDYNSGLFDRVRKECEREIISGKLNISGSDISEEAVIHAKRNSESAGLEGLINFRQSDFSQLKPIEDEGFILINPPYGQRIKPSDSEALYSMIGSTLKHSFPGYKACIISSDKEALKHVGLKPAKKIILYNGALQCELIEYDLYSGSHKKHKFLLP